MSILIPTNTEAPLATAVETAERLHILDHSDPRSSLVAFHELKDDPEVESLLAKLNTTLQDFADSAESDSLGNPVLNLAIDLMRRIETRDLTYLDLERMIQHLSVEGFLNRAERLRSYIGEIDRHENVERLRTLILGLALRGQDMPADDARAIVPFELFRDRVKREIFGIVITAHPTFNLSGEQMTLLADLAAWNNDEAVGYRDKALEDRLKKLSEQPHRPERMTLDREHALSLEVIENIQFALRTLYDVIFAVAADLYPDHWRDLVPRLITVASWVGYDLDGRSDIGWTDMLHKRLKVKVLQLKHYLGSACEIREMVTSEPRKADLVQILDLLVARLDLAVRDLTDEIAVFDNPTTDPETSDAYIRAISNRICEELHLRLIDGADLIAQIDRAVSIAESDHMVRKLLVWRTEIANYGLGMGHAHFRINESQLLNAIRKTVRMDSTPDDPRFRSSYLEKLETLLRDVKPVTINFASIMRERTDAKRLFMVIAQTLKYVDVTTPIRFLIAECESAITVLIALYYAKLFGVDDRVDISPLFETRKALEVGSRIIDQLLSNAHFRDYVQQRGRLCVQTGYSDAGRYIGQTPAAASIERLRERLCDVLAKHDLTDVQIVCFDTHGESIGRGAHPVSFADRLNYQDPPENRAHFAEKKIDFKEEVSFQGGDGFLYFMNSSTALAVLARILEHSLGSSVARHDDPFYNDRNYVREFFTTVSNFQTDLMSDVNYGVLLSIFGGNFFYKSGSRASRRQHETAIEAGGYPHAAEIRAIPHNATLQQLGVLVNSISGVGTAIDRDPARFRALYRSSSRFRQLLGIVEYGAAVSNTHAMKAYIDIFDPGFWLYSAAATWHADPAWDMRKIANLLENNETAVCGSKVFRKIYKDASILVHHLEAQSDSEMIYAGAVGVTQMVRDKIALLHALRLALIGEIFRLAMRIPDFSNHRGVTPASVMARILHLDVPGAVRRLEHIFPLVGARPCNREEDFGEEATYVSDDNQTYQVENMTIFRPMNHLYDLSCRASSAITQLIGSFG